MSHGYLDSRRRKQKPIPLDTEIVEPVRLENVPTDRSVCRAASQGFQPNPFSPKPGLILFSPAQVSGEREEHDGSYYLL